MSTEAPESGDVLARLHASGQRLAVLEEEHRAEKSRRDELVIAARDLGESWRSIARQAGVSVSRCVAIVAGD